MVATAETPSERSEVEPGSAASASSKTKASQVDAVMRASRVLLAVVSQSVAEVENVVTPPQLRVLVLIATEGPQNLGAVAADLKVHPSNATRLCERLVSAGLVRRREDPADRRYLKLMLSPAGKSLVQRVMNHRSDAIAAVLEHMQAAEVDSLTASLHTFAGAAEKNGAVAERFALGVKE